MPLNCLRLFALTKEKKQARERESLNAAKKEIRIWEGHRLTSLASGFLPFTLVKIDHASLVIFSTMVSWHPASKD